MSRNTGPVLLLLLAGCCGYSTHSLLPSHLRTVAIPPAGNSSGQPAVAEALTDSLISAFRADRSLRLTDENSADLTVLATVTSYSREAASYQANQSVTAYELRLTASVAAQDRVRDEEFYSGTASASIVFNPDSAVAAATPEEAAMYRAAGRLAREVVRQVLTAW